MIDEKLWDICLEIYTRLYQEADPSADFDELMEKAKRGELEPDFYENHYLNNERQHKIVEEVMDKYSLSNKDKQRVKVEVLLGSAPISVKEGKT